MDKIRIEGGHELNGTIDISGAKNAALPLMTACLLTDKTLTLRNVPHLKDVTSLAAVLGELGVNIAVNGSKAGTSGQTLEITANRLSGGFASYDLVRKMRASVLVLGPLVARLGEACVSLPGGCAIGTRPVDLHIAGLEALGAEITLDEGYIKAKAPSGGLKGGHILFPKVSVGATENIMMAATLARGETTIANAAREPEVTDLGRCLVKMGARIEGLGTDTLRITGVDQLGGCDHSVIPDRIETGTYAIAAAMTGGRITLKNTSIDLIESLIDPLHKAGIDVLAPANDTIEIKRAGNRLMGVDIMTEPFPGFPTDLQAQFMALLTIAEGAGMVTETIFENRFMHVPELARMGANITVHGSSALVRGVPRLKGAQVMATDLRASVSLVLAGLVAQGETVINRIYHLDRGYENLVEKLTACGAKLERVA